MRAGNFVEETTTSIAGTSGDGAVTLTAITSTPRFSTVFGTQATTIRYVIEDTVAKKFETGIGSVSSNVLTRTRPQVTWDGSTYDDSTPSPIAFGSTPTSGNIKIRLAATAENNATNLIGTNMSVGGDSWRDYPITANVGNDSNGAAGTLTANLEYYACYLLPIAGLLNGVQLDVTTGVAGSMKVALLSVGTDGFPSQKIVDFNVVNVTTTGIKTDTTTSTWTPAGPVWLTPGWYYIGFISDVATAIRGIQGNGSPGVKSRTPLSRQGGYGWANAATRSGSYATGIPATPSAPTALLVPNNFLSVPWIGLKVVP